MPPVGSRRLSRARTWAGAAVTVLIVADVWLVAAAARGSDEGTSAFVTMTQLGFRTGTADRGPVDSVDSAESVPDSATGTSAVVERGDAHFTVVAVPGGATAATAVRGRTVRYTIEAEGGLGIDPATFAKTVTAVLTDPRGWQHKDGVRFVNVSPPEAARGASPDLRIRLTSPNTTDSLCAPLLTRGEVSCHNGDNVVLNSRRWLLGAQAYGTDLAGYRTYLVNHEVGHGIGHGHAQCGRAGQVAPVMMQQTYGLDGCTAWPWPSAKPA